MSAPIGGDAVNPASLLLLAAAIPLWSRANLPHTRLARLGGRRPHLAPRPQGAAPGAGRSRPVSWPPPLTGWPQGPSPARHRRPRPGG